MNSINLIPANRLERARARQRLRAWSGILLIYALAVTLGCGLALAALAGGESGSGGVAAGTFPGEIERTQRDIAANRARLLAVRARLDALRTITGQADWSTLVAAVAGVVEDEIVLTGLRLDPARPQAPPRSAATPTLGGPAAITPAAFVVSISGEGVSQAAVSQFVLRLERIGVFSQVRLVRTSRSPRARDDGSAGEVVGFQVEANISPLEGR